MSELFENHIVGFLMTRLIYSFLVSCFQVAMIEPYTWTEPAWNVMIRRQKSGPLCLRWRRLGLASPWQPWTSFCTLLVDDTGIQTSTTILWKGRGVILKAVYINDPLRFQICSDKICLLIVSKYYIIIVIIVIIIIIIIIIIIVSCPLGRVGLSVK